MRLFAIVPAAGLSRRMGQPKLVMDLLGKPVVQRLLETLAQPEVVATAIVMRKSDEELQRCVSPLKALAVLPEVDPPDMRASVEYGLAALEEQFHPEPDDGWLLIPADHPILDASTLRDLIDLWQRSDADVLIPCHEGQRGHPAFFRWNLVRRLQTIPNDQGINWLLTAKDVRIEEAQVDSRTVLLDLDTPSDFEVARRLLSNEDG
jgi:molybdenum cofactor cytidylyltransferase